VPQLGVHPDESDAPHRRGAGVGPACEALRRQRRGRRAGSRRNAPLSEEDHSRERQGRRVPVEEERGRAAGGPRQAGRGGTRRSHTGERGSVHDRIPSRGVGHRFGDRGPARRRVRRRADHQLRPRAGATGASGIDGGSRRGRGRRGVRLDLPFLRQRDDRRRAAADVDPAGRRGPRARAGESVQEARYRRAHRHGGPAGRGRSGRREDQGREERRAGRAVGRRAAGGGRPPAVASRASTPSATSCRPRPWRTSRPTRGS